jgi:choline dehydrogenase
VDVLVRGLKLLFRIAKTSPLKEALDDTEKDDFLDQNLHKLDDKELAEVVKKRVETAYHPCCTARMVPLKDGGVVDPQLRVYGIANLRVVDASVFPKVIAGHTVSAYLFVTSRRPAELSWSLDRSLRLRNKLLT